MKSRTVPSFWDCHRRLPLHIREAARKAFRLFQDDPAHPSLSLERLVRGPGFWSVRVTRDYRAVGVRDGDEILWIWIGLHDEFDRRFSR
jgi:hypothetical protein